MSYTAPLLLTGDQIASVSSITQVSNPGQPGFGMTLGNVTALGTGSQSYRLVWWQNVNGSATQFQNGQGWRLEVYTGTGDPATDTDPASWSPVPGLANLGPRNDVVSGVGAGDEYIVFDAGGTYLLYDLNGDLPTTPTDLYYSGTADAQNGDPTLGDNDSELDFADGYASHQPICFCTGTLIQTNDGPRPVEELAVGDLVQTLDRGPQPIRWIGRREVTLAETIAHPDILPVRVAAGAMGAGLPRRDLWLSPQHRVLVRSRIAERMVGSAEALVAVKHLCGLPGIEQTAAPRRVGYLHLRLDRHEVIRAEGLWAETLLVGQQALKSLGPEARAELRLLFPALIESATDAARILLPGRVARKLAERHGRNAKALVDAQA